LELHPQKATVVRLLAYVNQANMGVYRDAVRNALTASVTPDITAHLLSNDRKIWVRREF
jgi:hypothetical protein